MRGIKHILIGLLVFLFSTIGFSQPYQQSWQNTPSNSKGVYIDAGIGTAISHADVFGESLDNAGGFASVLFLGYKFNPYLAVEGGLNYVDISNSGSLTYYPIAVKGILPLGIEKRFKIFGKIGAAFARSETELFLGLGAAYAVMPSLDVAVEMNGASDLFSSVSLLTINLIYHF